MQYVQFYMLYHNISVKRHINFAAFKFPLSSAGTVNPKRGVHGHFVKPPFQCIPDSRLEDNMGGPDAACCGFALENAEAIQPQPEF